MNMEEIVCPCMGVSVGDIKEAIDNGATSVEEVKDATMAGSCCGRCTDDIESLVEKFLS